MSMNTIQNFPVIKVLYFVSLILLNNKMATNLKLSISSYNSQGSSPSRMAYISKLLENNDFVFIQEHWLRKCQFNMYNVLQNANLHSISAMDDEVLSIGRPFGGCAIIWKNSLMLNICPVDLQSNRCCAVTFKIGVKIYLLCNVYMPVNNNQSVNEYAEVLASLALPIKSGHYDYVIIGGDFNVSFDLSGGVLNSNANSSCQNLLLLEEFIDVNLLSVASQHPNSNVKYTFEGKGNGVKSIIDHFVISNELLSNVHEYNSVHEGDNCSDHCPIILKLDIPVCYSKVNDHKTENKRLDWSKLSDDDICNYKKLLDIKLDEVKPYIKQMNCSGTTCNDINHYSHIQKIHDIIIEATVSAGVCSSPLNKKTGKLHKGKKQAVPGWTTHVREKQQDAIFWHSLWKSAGSPQSGVLFDIRKSTRLKYHYAIKMIKKCRDLVTSNNMAESMLSNKPKEFWSDVKKVRGGKFGLPATIDGISNNINISEAFAKKFEELYNSVSYDVNEMHELKQEIGHYINQKCDQNQCYCNHKITVNDVVTSVKSLKRAKVDGNCDQMSDHIIFGTHKLYVTLSLVFEAMLRHGYVPNGLLISTILPITKGKNIHSSDNYRGIALSSIVGKIFDRIILNNHYDKMSSSDMQFGFKPDHSTSQCTFVLNEIIQYYRNNGSNVNVCMLDASKAFDRVHYVKLFRLLIKRGICPIIARVLINLYTNQKVKVKWGNSNSDFFTISNGVKQGGILSPILFTMYIDEMFLRLKNSGVGCYVGSNYCGALGYADDATLISPSIFALKIMLDIVYKFGKEFNVSFNPNKNKLLCYSANPTNDVQEINYNNTVIKSEHVASHLGNNLCIFNPACDIDKVTNKFIQSVNYVLCFFNKCNNLVKYRLFKTYCMSLYGSLLWDYSCSHINFFVVQCKKSLRKLLGLPTRTHSKLIHLICEDSTPLVQLHKRLVKFLFIMLKSKNTLINLCANLAINGSSSKICNSINHISYLYGIDKYNLDCTSVNNIIDTSSSNEDLLLVGNIIDLCFLRDSHNNIFSKDEINFMLNYLCTR